MHHELPDRFSIIEVPGDGHCIFYSWEIALNVSSTSGFKPKYTSLLDLARIEFLTNQDHYKPFFTETTVNYGDEIDKTLVDKDYGNGIADMMANALSNSTKTTAVIWQKENDQLVQRNIINPAFGANPVNGVIHLLRDGQHYEPIVERHHKGICEILKTLNPFRASCF